MKRYFVWWKETPGIMTMIHFALLGFLTVVALLLLWPVWLGLGAFVAWLLVMASTVHLGALVDTMLLDERDRRRRRQ